MAGKELRNFLVLRDFRSYWDAREIGDWFHVTLTNARCSVSYTCRGQTLEVKAGVQFRHSSGEVEIEEDGGLGADNYYLGSSPRHQTLMFDKRTGALVIKGSGEKTSGNYTVRINPLRDGR